MQEYLEVIKKSKLFYNITDKEIELLFECLNVKINDYDKGEFIFNSGEPIKEVGLILKGKVHVINEDYWGNRSIFRDVTEGEIVGDSFACADEVLPVSILSVEKTKMMLIDFKRIVQTCSVSASIREIIIGNLLNILSKNNIILTEKINHMSKRSTREKLLSYLSEQARKNKSSSFSISFNRQQLADYLCIERSSMSNELSKLRNEGILEYEKEKFKLLNIE